MLNSEVNDYYRSYFGSYFADYLKDKEQQDSRLNLILFIFIISIFLASIGLSKPIFAKTDTNLVKMANSGQEIYLYKNFKENIENKYAGSYITFPYQGVAHIKKIKYINSKPIKINIVELNTKVNPNLKIKPQIASDKLHSKRTVRKIAQNNQAIIAVNGGFFKPATAVPLGALMIDGEILSGPIYNRVGIVIFEDDNNTSFKMSNIYFDITAYSKNNTLKIDNINQPRMLSTYTLLYTSIWGEYSPPPPKNGYNMLIRDGKVLKISANPIKIEQNDFVIQSSKDKISKIGKDREINIKIELPAELRGAEHIIGAGPYLVKDSEIYVDYKEQKLQAISGKNPRSAIGYNSEGTFIIVTVDGREKASVGMTLYELAKLMKNLGCEYAMNFDGGSSSALYVKGKIVNNAINTEGIPVSNALIVSEINPNELQISNAQTENTALNAKGI